MPPGAQQGTAAAAMRELLASLPDERQRIEGLQLLDRLIHEERACGGRLAHLAHVYPNLSMPNSAPPLGLGAGWGGGSSDQLLERQDTWMRFNSYHGNNSGGDESSFNALQGGSMPQMPGGWPSPQWDAKDSGGSGLLKRGENREPADSAGLGWAGMVKDLELEDEQALGSLSGTESRILSFVFPTSGSESPGVQQQPSQAPGMQQGSQGQAAMHAQQALAGAGQRGGGSATMGPSLAGQHDSRAEGTASTPLEPAAAAPKFSSVLTQKAPAQAGAGSQAPAEGAVPNGPNGGSARMVLPGSSGVVAPSSGGAPASGVTSGSTGGVARARSGSDGMGVAAAGGASSGVNVEVVTVTPPTAAAIVANGVDKSADMASVVKREADAVPAKGAGSGAGTPSSGTSAGGRGWETATAAAVRLSLAEGDLAGCCAHRAKRTRPSASACGGVCSSR